MKNQNTLILGDWNAICDRCGFKFKASDLREEWDGLMVCKDCWEPRQPQDLLRGIPDPQTVPWARPDDSTGQVTTVGDANKTLTLGTDAQSVLYGTTLTANRTITITAGNGPEDIGQVFNIYRTDGAAFTLDVGGLYTVPASVNMLVSVRWNGTAWVLDSTTGLN